MAKDCSDAAEVVWCLKRTTEVSWTLFRRTVQHEKLIEVVGNKLQPSSRAYMRLS